MFLILDIEKAEFLNDLTGFGGPKENDYDVPKMLFDSPWKHLKQIEEISKTILINFNKDSIAQGDILEYLSNENVKSNEYNKNIIGMLRSSKIFNVQELKELSNNDIVQMLKDYIGNAKIVFFINWISTNLLAVLKQLDGVEGYWQKMFNGEFKEDYTLARISDLNRFYDFYESMERCKKSKLTDDDIIPSRYVETFLTYKEEDSPVFTQSIFYKHFNDLINGKQRKIFLIGGDKYLSNKFIIEAGYKIGYFERIDLFSDEIKPRKWNKQLVIFFTENVEKSLLNKLIKELQKRKHNTKNIILRSDADIEELTEKDFCKVHVPSFNHCKAYLSNFFYLMAKEKNLFWTGDEYLYHLDYRLLFKLTCINVILENIPSLSELAQLIEDIKNIPNMNPRVSELNFWLDLDDCITRKYTQINKSATATDVTNQSLPVENESNKYVFIKEPNGDYHIVFAGKEIYVKNKKADGLFYIQQIIKHGTPEAITAFDLYTSKNGRIKSTVSSKSRSNPDDIELNSEDSSVSVSESSMEKKTTLAIKNQHGVTLTDEKSINEIKNTQKKIRDKIDENIKNGICDNQELENDYAYFEDYLKKNVNKKGKSKKTNDPVKLAKKAIDNALKKIKNETKLTHPEFSKFIKKDIIYQYKDYSYFYIKREHIHWQLI